MRGGALVILAVLWVTGCVSSWFALLCTLLLMLGNDRD